MPGSRRTESMLWTQENAEFVVRESGLSARWIACDGEVVIAIYLGFKAKRRLQWFYPAFAVKNKWVRAMWKEDRKELEFAIPRVWIEDGRVRWPNTLNAASALKEQRRPTEESSFAVYRSRNFISKKQEAVLKSKSKLQEQKQKRVLCERKKEKAKRRKQALDHLASRGWENEMRRAQVRNVLKVEFTSSDEECDGGFITHPISWQCDKLTKVKSHLDKTFLEICSVKSKRMLQSRSVGAANIKPTPTFPEVFPWMVKKDKFDLLEV
ncbi:uncharacterized protein LOC133199781 [Saccostrea echinata]|uniref:uncharacterized protein LOC133199781 n=1 Tax=Saccostrea echinata TaxID=191078 RepID=UPI002A7EAC65|nr:uncharacterized protein LOC133199781 [Saccostrea echinata]